MPTLVSLDDLRTRLQFDNTNAINNALLGALLSATDAMSSMLRTPFDQESYTDFFSRSAHTYR
jgi:hypothetical protein